MEISLMGREWQGDVIQIQWDVYKVSQKSFLAEGWVCDFSPIRIHLECCQSLQWVCCGFTWDWHQNLAHRSSLSDFTRW